MSISISLTGQIAVSDGTTGAVSLQKQVSAAMIIGSFFSEAQGLTVGTAVTNLTLPGTPVQFLYIKNLHAVQTVIVTWTPLGGASNVVTVLEPGAVIILVETNPGAGLSAVSLQASGASTPVEFLIGG